MKNINTILELLFIFFGILTTVFCLTIPKQKIWITLLFGFVTGFLLFINFSSNLLLNIFLACLSGLFSSLFFSWGGVRVQNNARKGWDEYKRTHKR